MATSSGPSGKKSVAPATAKLFKNGRSQAVRLPKEFRFEGTEVRIRRTKKGVLLEPVPSASLDGVGTRRAEIARWFADLDRFNETAGEFMPKGRQQPKMPVREFPADW